MWFQATASRWGNVLGKQRAPEITLLSVLFIISSHLKSKTWFSYASRRTETTVNRQNVLTFNVTDFKTWESFITGCAHCSLLGSIDPSFRVAPIFMKEMQVIPYSACTRSPEVNLMFCFKEIIFVSVAGFAANTLTSEYNCTGRTNPGKPSVVIVHTAEMITTNYFIHTGSFTYFISGNPVTTLNLGVISVLQTRKQIQQG